MPQTPQGSSRFKRSKAALRRQKNVCYFTRLSKSLQEPITMFFGAQFFPGRTFGDEAL